MLSVTFCVQWVSLYYLYFVIHRVWRVIWSEAINRKIITREEIWPHDDHDLCKRQGQKSWNIREETLFHFLTLNELNWKPSAAWFAVCSVYCIFMRVELINIKKRQEGFLRNISSSEGECMVYIFVTVNVIGHQIHVPPLFIFPSHLDDWKDSEGETWRREDPYRVRSEKKPNRFQKTWHGEDIGCTHGEWTWVCCHVINIQP